MVLNTFVVLKMMLFLILKNCQKFFFSTTVYKYYEYLNKKVKI